MSTAIATTPAERPAPIRTVRFGRVRFALVEAPPVGGPPRRLVVRPCFTGGRPHLAVPSDAIHVLAAGWGSPFRIVEPPGAHHPFHVMWCGKGVASGRIGPKPPARIKCDGRDEAQRVIVSELLKWLSHPDRADVRSRIREALGGKHLACFCAPHTPCHAEVLLYIANRGREGGPPP